MTRFSKVALSACLAIGMSATSAIAQDVTLRFQHFISPKGSVPAFFMAPWADKVMEESNGRIKVELYPGMQLGGKPPAIYDQIRDGVIDGGWTIPSYNPGRFPEAEALELPFITGLDAEASSRAAWEYAEKYLMERMSDVHLLAVHVHGPGIIHKRGEPVKTVADFTGLKLRGPSRQANTLLEAMGATPVGMPVPAFPEALSKGVVDGGVIPWEIVPALKVQELADSHTSIAGERSLYNTFFIWAMNKSSYENLPADLKAIIDANSGLEASAWAGRAMDEGDTLAEKLVADTDNAVHVMDAAEVAKIQTLGDAQIAAWIEDMNSKGLDGEAMVEDVRALMTKHAGQ